MKSAKTAIKAAILRLTLTRRIKYPIGWLLDWYVAHEGYD